MKRKREVKGEMEEREDREEREEDGKEEKNERGDNGEQKMSFGRIGDSQRHRKAAHSLERRLIYYP